MRKAIYGEQYSKLGYDFNKIAIIYKIQGQHEKSLESYKQSFEYLSKDVKQGNIGTLANLAWFYSNGLGVDKDDAMSLELYQKASNQENAEAQSNLGSLYEEGRGVPIDYAKALEWYQKSAAQNKRQAQAHLGLIYVMGRGVPKDETRGLEYIQEALTTLKTDARESLNFGAPYALASLYEVGAGLEQSDLEAMLWYEKAQAQGDIRAESKIVNLKLKQKAVFDLNSGGMITASLTKATTSSPSPLLFSNNGGEGETTNHQFKTPTQGTKTRCCTIL